MTPWLLGLLAGVAVFLALGPGPNPARPLPLARLYAKLGAPSSATGPRSDTIPWVRRLPIKPLVAAIRPFFTARYQAKIERLLRISGLDTTHTYADILAMKVALPLFCLVNVIIFNVPDPDWVFVDFLSAACLVSFFYPDSWLGGRARRKQEAIRRELPAFLSALAVALEAGLNLMGSVAEVTKERPGVLAAELRQAVERHERGLSAAEALEGVATRVEVSDLTVVLTGLLQAFAKGSGHVVATVRSQAAEAWLRRRRRAETLAQTASAKLFLPLALLAFPGFLIFLLGPAVLETIKYFK